jgi:hypothetical protein
MPQECGQHQEQITRVLAYEDGHLHQKLGQELGSNYLPILIIVYPFAVQLI